MDIKDVKKWIELGHLRKNFKVIVGAVVVGAVGLPLLYGTFADSSSSKSTAINADVDNSSDVSAEQIEKITHRKGGLWANNYIWIGGKKYQLKYTKDGRIQVLEDGQLIDLAKAVGSQGAIVNKDGKMYYYTPNQDLIDLNSGDIIPTDQGISRVDGNVLTPIKSNELFNKDHQINYVDPYTDENHPLKDGEIVTVDGKAMRMNSNVLRPLSDYFANVPDGSYIAKDVDGHLEFFLKKGGHLIPVKRKDIPDGATVYLDAKAMTFHDGKLFSQEQSLVGVLTLADLNKVLVNDYIVKIGEQNGYPTFFKKGVDSFASVSATQIPDYALVYYNSKPFTLGKSEKLIAFKVSVGEPFIKADKPFVIDNNSEPLMLKAGDMVEYQGLTLIVNDQGRFMVLSDAQKQSLKKYPNRLIVVNGVQKLYGKAGQVSSLRNSNIIFRNGEPYKYIDGQWVKLSQAEIDSIKEQANPEKKPKKVISNNYAEPDIDPNELVAISASEIAAQGSSAISSPKSNGLADALSANERAREKAMNDIDSLIKNGSQGSQNKYESQNDQTGKQAFLDSQKSADIGKFKQPNSPYYIATGTVIDGTMISGINSDLPGHIEAIVNSNVYDSINHNNLLIPAGTKIWGAYSSQVSYGQKRIIMAWNQLIFPNGVSMNLAGQEGYDLTGAAGIEGDVDNHYWDIFKDVSLMSLFGAGAQYAAGLTGSGGGLDGLSLIAASIGQQIGQTGIELVQKTMNIQPTIKIEQGTKFKILVDHGIVFASPYQFHQPLKFVYSDSTGEQNV